MSDERQRERLLDLLAERATDGLAPALRPELERLLAEFPDEREDSLDLAAAAAELALAPPAQEPLPEALRRGIELSARRFAAEAALAESAPRSSALRARVSWREAAGWLAAAAVLATVLLRATPALEPLPAPSPAQERSQLVSGATDVITLPWTATGDSAGPQASGDVVWSPSQQLGFMRFRGLAANDPQQQQYQLWIFDAERDERHPVDGGVFDIPPGVDEVVVPIDARLHVSNLTLFAVTIEKPGGVVVSSRERLPLLAKVGD